MKLSSPKPRILVGVTGSVAAYKAVDLVRRLRDFSEVRVVLTEAGSRLVPEKSLRRASGQPVGRGLFEGAKAIPPGTPSGTHPLTTIPHIEFAKKADLLLIAPASADAVSPSSTAGPGRNHHPPATSPPPRSFCAVVAFQRMVRLAG